MVAPSVGSARPGSGSWEELQEAERRAKAGAVLALLVAHVPCLTRSPADVGSIARTCRPFRAALEQAAAGATAVRLGQGATLHSLRSFASWLPRHAGLVRLLRLHCCHASGAGQADAAEAAGLLRGALEQCACRAAPAGAVGAARSRLRLQHLASDLPNSPALLAALPPDCLTALELTNLPAAAVVAAGSCSLAAALAALSQLRGLCLSSGREAAAVLPPAALGALPQLVVLRVRGLRVPAQSLGLLPASLRSLQVCVSDDALGDGGAPAWLADVRRLSHLRQLDIAAPRCPGEAALLPPPHLTALSLACPAGAQLTAPTLAIDPPPRALRTLSLAWAGGGLAALAPLEPALLGGGLSELRLLYTSSAALAQDAPLWAGVPQLRALVVHLMFQSHEVFRCDAALHHLRHGGGGSALTSLTLNAPGLDGACVPLLVRSLDAQWLPQLRRLALNNLRLAAAEAEALPGLSRQLRSLDLRGCGPAVDDLAVARVVLALPHLAELDVSRCGLLGWGWLRLLARRAAGLCSLRAVGAVRTAAWAPLDAHTLLTLTALTCLSELALPRSPRLPAEARAALHAALPLLHPHNTIV